MPVLSVPIHFSGSVGVTIIIVANNEEKSIGRCLKGIISQTYSPDLMEIIVVDDHSTDGTLFEIQKIGNPLIRTFSLKDIPDYIQGKAFKKSGITLAADKAKFENIIVTDADCIHSTDWLRTMMFHFQLHNSAFQTAPVLINEENSLLIKMQEMEQLMLMLITGAGIQSRIHDLANGANMAFRKSAFVDIKGFEGNYNYPSGDDMFLIEKTRIAFPSQVTFVKSTQATVYAEGKQNWNALLKQRLRWAGKNKGLKNKSIKRIWLFVGVYHVVMILALLAALFQLISPWSFILLLCVKWTMDYLLLATSASFFKKTSLLRYFVPLQFLYSYYVLRLGVMMMMGRKGDWERGFALPSD
jgi:glycosyltransferase involved in cell wall biosynthesis